MISHFRSLGQRCRSILSHRLLPAGLAVLAVLLNLPALWGRWTLDDLIHRGALLGKTPFHLYDAEGLNIFVYFDGNSQRTRALIDRGLAYWWTMDGIRNGVWRPLSALSHWIDVHLLQDSVVLAHAHNLVWMSALVLAVTVLYRYLLGPTWIAGLGALFFALDDSHQSAAAWVGNRNSLIAGLFTAIALWAHVRWRREGSKAAAILAPICVILGLLAKEEGLAAPAFILGYAAFVDNGPLPRRLMTLVPSIFMTAFWFVLYRHYHIGAWGIGHYIDPGSDPIRFVAAMLERMPVLLLGLFAVPASDYYNLAQGPLAYVYQAVAISFVLVFSYVALPLVRHDGTARMWVLGTLLSLVPICAVIPTSRLQVLPGLGALALVAQLTGALADDAVWMPRQRPYRVLATAVVIALIFCNLVVAPVSMILGTIGFVRVTRLNDYRVSTVPKDPAIAEQQLVMVTAPSFFHMGTHVFSNLLEDKPFPLFTRALALSNTPVRVTRSDQHTLLVRPDSAFFPDIPYAWVVRDKFHPMRQGETIELSDFQIQVTEVTPDGRPAEAAFRFSIPLESQSLRWVSWKEPMGFIPFTLPAIGESVVVRR